MANATLRSGFKMSAIDFNEIYIAPGLQLKNQKND